MLLARRSWRALLSAQVSVRQLAAPHHTAARMGEDCCGTSAPSAPTEQFNGLQLNGTASNAPSNGKGVQPRSHKEAAEELQDWIRKRIELFDQFSERQKQAVSDLLAQASSKVA